MFPIRDENPTLRTPVVTYWIIGLNVLAWLLIERGGSELPLVRSLCVYGLIPGELLGNVPPGTQIVLSEHLGCVLGHGGNISTLLSHAFLHGSWFHLIANMWFLWIFGDNVEDSMGGGRFIAFYLLCALAAATAQIMTDPSATTPMVGASGAIGGVMGAYARLYPKAYVHCVFPVFFYIMTAAIPAAYMLGYWFFIQLLSGIPALGGGVGGVAFWAHVGGFVAGLLLIGPMHRPDYLAEHNALDPNRSAKHRF
ncbi:MAG: rhomboid family intramembrane serine protease [Gammaproteobacteria bacterium]